MFKLILTGNVGGEPQTRADKSGNQFVTFSVAVSLANKKTEWVDVITSGKTSQIAQSYVHKGSKVIIEGTPSINCYINTSGEAVAKLKLSAYAIEVMDKVVKNPSEGEDHESAVYELPEVPQNKSISDLEEIPF